MIITKRAIFPFNSWLPGAIAAPTPVSALVHSRTLVTSGVTLNFKFKVCYSVYYSKRLIVILGVITILLGSLGALISVDLKKRVAFTTISQIGFLMFSLTSINPFLTLTYLVTHAFLKVLLFMLRGVFILSCRRQNLFKISKRPLKLKILRRVVIIIVNFMS